MLDGRGPGGVLGAAIDAHGAAVHAFAAVAAPAHAREVTVGAFRRAGTQLDGRSPADAARLLLAAAREEAAARAGDGDPAAAEAAFERQSGAPAPVWLYGALLEGEELWIAPPPAAVPAQEWVAAGAPAGGSNGAARSGGAWLPAAPPEAAGTDAWTPAASTVTAARPQRPSRLARLRAALPARPRRPLAGLLALLAALAVLAAGAVGATRLVGGDEPVATEAPARPAGTTVVEREAQAEAAQKRAARRHDRLLADLRADRRRDVAAAKRGARRRFVAAVRRVIERRRAAARRVAPRPAAAVPAVPRTPAASAPRPQPTAAPAPQRTVAPAPTSAPQRDSDPPGRVPPSDTP